MPPKEALRAQRQKLGHYLIGHMKLEDGYLLREIVGWCEEYYLNTEN